MSMSKRSPPAMPPAVLTNTPDSPSCSGEGKRTRSEPDSYRSPRRVTPSCRCTPNRTAPWARLAANVAETARVLSVRIRPPNATPDTALQRHLAADLGGIEAGSVAGIFHRAAVHDRKIVAELAGKVEILFDQHDRHIAEAAQIGDGAADILDDRGLDAFGRLVEQQQFRPHHQRPADRQLLLLSAGQIAAAAAQHRVQHRKQREHVVGDMAVLALERPKSGLQILLDRQQRKNLAALRHEADAGPRALVRFEAGDVVPLKGDRTARYRVLPDHRAQQRGLADAVAAEHAGDLARLRRQRDTEIGRA